MRAYAVFINEQALAAAPRLGTQRENVMKFIRSLADNPNIAGDFTEKDNGGQNYSGKSRRSLCRHVLG